MGSTDLPSPVAPPTAPWASDRLQNAQVPRPKPGHLRREGGIRRDYALNRSTLKAFFGVPVTTRVLSSLSEIVCFLASHSGKSQPM